MLYKTVSVAFAATAVSGFSPAMPSKLAASKVARASDIEMAKKSVGDLSKADLEACVLTPAEGDSGCRTRASAAAEPAST